MLANRVGQALRIADVAFDKGSRSASDLLQAVQNRTVAVAEVVVEDHITTRRCKHGDRVRSDKAGTAGEKDGQVQTPRKERAECSRQARLAPTPSDLQTWQTTTSEASRSQFAKLWGWWGFGYWRASPGSQCIFVAVSH